MMAWPGADPVAFLRRLIDDEAFAGACGAKGAMRARGFSWDRTARQVYAAYQHAMRRRHTR